MNLEPQKLFIGLMDFFSILLPGALLAYLLMDEMGPPILGWRTYQTLTGAEGWTAFLVASYLLGHLIFLLGSWLDEWYDSIKRRYTLEPQISRLALRNKQLSWLVRAVVWAIFKDERNLAVERASLIKEQALEPLQAKASINTFQWSKALLMLESPESLATVQRFEADSKFFRSFVVVLVVLVGRWMWQLNGPLVALGLLLILAALWRYMEQRFKATNQAYWSVITLTARAGGKLVPPTAAPDNTGPARAGGVVYRMRHGKAEYLLVEAKGDPDQWVLPKGRVEPKEQLRETAVREVHEETGVWAAIRADLGSVSFTVDGTVITVQFFLMESVGRGMKSDGDFNRKHVWLPLSDAIEKKIHPETRDLLRSADRVRLAPPPMADLPRT